MCCPVMACVCMRFLCAVLPMLIVQGKPSAQPLSAPKNVEVYTEGDLNDLGVWKLNIQWMHGFTNSITPDTVTYDIKIFYTEQEKLVHNETIELKADQMGHYKWSWTSPLPLQCTSHSVQLRYRDHDHTSAWTPQKTLPGKDISDLQDIKVYPQNPVALVSEGIKFCCILNPGHDEQFRSSDFTIRISNRTYATKPILHPYPSPEQGFDITCKGEGASYYTGYAPADHSITCETRDLSFVECRWIVGQQFQNISKTVKDTTYSINGRNCPPKLCVLNESIDTGVMNWTLIAKNALGTKIIVDTADPKRRVHLKAPTLTPNPLFTARNATLEWKWLRLSKYSSFPMICQVELNGQINNERFKGKGLISVVLADLQPITEYKARVRCGSNEHFYKWGDWSNLITFVTKEDTPEPVDVWMQVFGERTYIVWKNLSAAQSHGIITCYKLVMGSSPDRNITKSPAELCHELRAGSAKTQHVISISAENSAGASRPSSITIPNRSPGGGVDIKGNNGTFDMVWEPSLRFTCGYVLDWYPTYKAQQCGVKWIRIPSGVSSATISPDIKEGVKYTLSVYGCTSGTLYTLLQRREGYMVELSPSGPVQNLTAKQKGVNISLFWRNVLEQEQRGLIKGYIVSYSHEGGDKRNVVISDPSTQTHNFEGLPGEAYTFAVRAFTSAGEGPESTVILFMDPQAHLVMINVIAGVVMMIFVLFIIAVLAQRNWKQLKSVLWPEVPKPELTEDFHKKGLYQCQVMNQLLYEESEVLKVSRKSPEICPALTGLQLEKEYHETQDLISHAKDSPYTLDYRTPNSKPQTLPLITDDLSYQELPCLGIQNPTYNLTLMPANGLVSAYRPQTQKGNIEYQPFDAHQ